MALDRTQKGSLNMCHSHRIQTIGWLGVLLALGACGAQARSTQAPDTEVSVVTEKLSSDGLVQSAIQRVDLAQLLADYPADVAAQVDVASMRADAIVGWYGKGNN